MRHEAAQVQTAGAVLGGLERVADDCVGSKLVLLDGLVDAHDVLPHNTAGANVEMADLGVAHEALGQADGERRGLELGEAGGALGERVHHGRLGGGDGVAVLGRRRGCNAPTINDD